MVQRPSPLTPTLSPLSPDSLPPHLLSPIRLDTPHPLLVGRGLAEVAHCLSGAVEVLTAEAAQLLKDAGAFYHTAAGDLVTPLYDAAGQLVSWRLWPSSSKANPTPKRLAPSRESGWPSAGVVWADNKGRAVLLSGAQQESVQTLLIVEGEPDGLTAAALVSRLEDVGVIGLCGAGAWSRELGARLTQWAEGGEGRAVVIATDRDKPGEGYAAQIRASVGAGVTVWRAAGEAGRADLNGLWRTGGAEAVWALLSGAAVMPPPPSAEAGRWAWSDDAAGWAEAQAWAQAREREWAWASSRAAAGAQGEGGEGTQAQMLERARAYVEAGLEKACAQLRHIDGDRGAALRAVAGVASYVEGGALQRGRAEAALISAYVRGTRQKRGERSKLIRDVLNGHSTRGAVSLDDIAARLAERDLTQGKRRADGGAAAAGAGTAPPCPAPSPCGAVGEAGEAAEERRANKGQGGAGVGVAEHGLRWAEDGAGVELCARYLPPDLLTQGVGEVAPTVVLRSAQGTGKTEALRALVLRALAAGQRVLILTHRRSLARSLSKRLGALAYLLTQGRLRIDRGQALVLSVNSLPRLVCGEHEGESFWPDLVICDESEQVTRHITGRTIKGDMLSVVTNKLRAVLGKAAWVVCADADAGPLTRLALAQSGRGAVLEVTNTWQGWGFNVDEGRRVEVLRDHTDKGRAMLVSQFKKAARSLKAGQTLVAACASKGWSEELAKMLQRAGVKGVLVVNSHRRNTPEVEQFLADPNNHLPRVLIYTETMGTGVSIDREVERVYFFGAAVEGVTGQANVQMMLRARSQRLPMLAWLENRTFKNMPHNANEAREKAEPVFRMIFNGAGKPAGVSAGFRERAATFADNRGLDFELWCAVEGETGRTGWHNVDCTLEALRARGAEIAWVDGDAAAVEPIKAEIKAAREDVIDEQVRAIVEALPLPPTANLDTLRQTGTPEAQAAVLRHDIEARSVEVTPDSARAALDGALGAGSALTGVAGVAAEGIVSDYMTRHDRDKASACPANMHQHKRAGRVRLWAQLLTAAGLGEVLREGGGAFGEVELNDNKRLEAVRNYIEGPHRTELEAVGGVALPDLGCKLHQVREYLLRVLKSLGFHVERPPTAKGGERRKGKARSYLLTRGAVVEAWRWAARSFAALVEAAELDAAQWAAAGVG